MKQKRLFAGLAAAATVAALVWAISPATAVVNQVNGQLIPVSTATNCPGILDKCLQTALNFGEGYNPPNKATGPKVDAIMDAHTGPGVFLVPKNASGQFVNVSFRLLQEGAGFENIFGWYNTGSPQIRYPAILSCAFGKKTGASGFEPPYYSGNKLAGGYKVTINFQSEFNKGRYKGGQIGFYLISPEGAPNGKVSGYRQGCATDPSDRYYSNNTGVDDDNTGSANDDHLGFGRIYFTESKLNNDGNYVHYLIYGSTKSSTTFYFAFEDLFRGGDNDFDDTAVQVEGLKAACLPDQEVCNGKDDNCDGKIDENLFQDCYSAKDPKTAGVGLCMKGKRACTGGKFTGQCVGEVVPGTEKCDGKDNDCNGVPDDNLGTLPPCSVGGCSGTMVCVKGKMVCAAPKPSTEICDGKDNDCNTQIDEKLTRICVSKCGTGVETCKFVSGSPTDAKNWTNCSAPTSAAEKCDGVDNDCDGVVDNGVPGTGLPCDHPSGQTCAKGKTACVGGSVICVGATPGLTEVCDCKDNDCDKQIDEGTPCPVGTKCINCGCRLPCTGQEFGCPKGFACANGYCVPDNCAKVTCPKNQKCVGGQCVPLCSGVNCGPGQVCKDGFCVEDSCYGQGCTGQQICYKGKCIDHPCKGITCKTGEYCDRGTCRPTCGNVACGAEGLCRDGVCIKNPCQDKVCKDGAPCHDGKCDAPCTGVNCGLRRMCRDGKCIDNPCQVVKCYGPGESCKYGQCIVEGYTYSGDVVDALASGGFGCAVPPGQETPPPVHLTFWLLLAAVALCARRQGR